MDNTLCIQKEHQSGKVSVIIAFQIFKALLPGHFCLTINIWIKKISSSLKMYQLPSQILRFLMLSTMVLDTIAAIEGGARKLIDEDTSNLRGSVFGVCRREKLQKYNSTMDQY